MKKLVVVISLLALSAVPVFSAQDEEPREQKESGAPTYESPDLSLLFLPVNLLIKMASITGPKSTSTPSPAAGSGTGK